MPIKSDEQILNEYLPKIKAFTDERLTAENAKRIYDYLRPYRYDIDGWAVEKAANEEKFPEDLCVKALQNIIEKMIDNRPYELPVFWNRLSYFENIFDKGWPTRDDLNEKIEREAKRVYDSATEDDLTNFHSEVEIKYQIKGALCSTSMTDEMIQAVYIKDNALDDVYRFIFEENRDDQIHLGVWEYLDKAERDYVAERVFDRMKLEYEDYLDEVKKMPPQKIIDEAYKLTILYDLHISLEPETSDFSTERLMALKSLDSPLWSLYNEWMRRDFTHMDDITDVIKETADERASEIEYNSFLPDNENEDEDEQEL